MISRFLESWLTQVIKRPQAIQLSGLRQTGKTTLMQAHMQQFPGALHYPLQDFVVFDRYHADVTRWVLEIEAKLIQGKHSSDQPLQVFVDEIQKIPALYQAIHGLYDKHKHAIKFWIWGSSARPQKKHRAETLAGRVLCKTLWPLTQTETLKSANIVPFLTDAQQFLPRIEIFKPRDFDDRLDRALRHSMLPEPWLADNSQIAADLLESYHATYIENEIRRENLVSDIGVFDRFVRLAADENGGVVNFQSKAQVLGLSMPTVKTYYDILKDTFLVHWLPVYSRSLRVRLQKHPKVYFSDAGLARYIAGHRGSLPQGTASFGQFFEAWVVAEIFKQVEYHALPWTLSHARTQAGLEVDVMIDTPEGTIAVEIKAAEKLNESDIKNIKKFMQLDSNIKLGVVFSMQSAPYKLADNIYNIPVWNI